RPTRNTYRSVSAVVSPGRLNVRSVHDYCSYRIPVRYLGRTEVPCLLERTHQPEPFYGASGSKGSWVQGTSVPACPRPRTSQGHFRVGRGYRVRHEVGSAD